MAELEYDKSFLEMPNGYAVLEEKENLKLQKETAKEIQKSQRELADAYATAKGYFVV